MAKDGKKAAAIGGIAALVTTLILATRAKAAPPIPPENIILSDLIVEPATVYVGELVSVSVIATNIGGSAGSYEVTCEVI